MHWGAAHTQWQSVVLLDGFDGMTPALPGAPAGVLATASAPPVCSPAPPQPLFSSCSFSLTPPSASLLWLTPSCSGLTSVFSALHTQRVARGPTASASLGPVTCADPHPTPDPTWNDRISVGILTNSPGTLLAGRSEAWAEPPDSGVMPVFTGLAREVGVIRLGRVTVGTFRALM